MTMRRRRADPLPSSPAMRTSATVPRPARRALLLVAALVALAAPAAAQGAETHQCLRTDVPFALTFAATHTTCSVARPVALAGAPKALSGRERFSVRVNKRLWKCVSANDAEFTCRSHRARILVQYS